MAKCTRFYAGLYTLAYKGHIHATVLPVKRNKLTTVSRVKAVDRIINRERKREKEKTEYANKLESRLRFLSASSC